MNDVITKLSSPPLTESTRARWVQTERAAHEAWGHLVASSPRAAALMHHIVSHMDDSAAVVASHATLAQIAGMSVATVRRAVEDLKARQWLQVVAVGGKGGANAYVVNSRVAWAASRDRLHLAAFSARVLANPAEQDAETLEGPPLRRVPMLRHSGEQQLPTGPGEDPPAQPALAGLEPDLPAVVVPDPMTGEIPAPAGILPAPAPSNRTR